MRRRVSGLTALAAAAMGISAAAISSGAAADVPTRYYCGGAVEWFASRWWERAGPATEGPSRQQLGEAPRACPTFSAAITVPGGIGTGQLETRPDRSGAAVDAEGSFVTTITPDVGLGELGALGHLLGRMFAGPGYTPEGRKMSLELWRLESRANRITGAVREDAEAVRSQFVADRGRLRQDLQAVRQRSSDLSNASAAATRDLRASLAARPAPVSPVAPTELGAALGLLETRRNVSEIAAAVPRPALRTEGRSIFGSLDGARLDAFGPDPVLGGALVRERAKVEAAMAGADRERADVLRYSTHALGVAERFAASGSAAGTRIAADLVRESQSIRLRATGRSPHIEVPIVRDDGTVGVAVVPDVQHIPLNAVSIFAARLEARRAAASTVLEDTSRRVAARGGTGPDAERAQLALETASDVIRAADSVFYSGALREGDGLLDIGTTLLDVALSVTPVIGWGKDLYEALTGKGLVTGQELSVAERSFAVFGVLTIGFGSKLHSGLTILEAVGPTLKRASRLKFGEAFGLAKDYIAVARDLAAEGRPLFTRGERLSNVVRWQPPKVRENGRVIDYLEDHFIKHRDEFLRPQLGGRALQTREEYLNRAIRFARSSDINNVSMVRESNNWVVKWNTATDEFGVFTPDGNIMTYYWMNREQYGDPLLAFIRSATKEEY